VGILLAFAVAMLMLAIADRGLRTFAEPCCALVVSPPDPACQDLMGKHHEQRQFAFAPLNSNSASRLFVTTSGSLVEQAAAFSGAEDEARNADRIAQQTEELEKLVKQRDALLKK
jgi:hypothetical protein